VVIIAGGFCANAMDQRHGWRRRRALRQAGVHDKANRRRWIAMGEKVRASYPAIRWTCAFEGEYPEDGAVMAGTPGLSVVGDQNTRLHPGEQALEPSSLLVAD